MVSPRFRRAEADFPLTDFIAGAVKPLFNRLYYTDAET